MRQAQMSSAVRIILGGGISLAIVFTLYAAVSLTGDVSGDIETTCHPQWHVQQTTRILLQTERRGEPLRIWVGRAVNKDNITRANSMIRSAVNDSQRVNWFWTINGQRGGSPGIQTSVVGATRSEEILQNRDPLQYMYGGADITIKAIAINTDNPC
jgi:hypothetical protein